MAKVLCVLYDDPADGYPKSYARNDFPQVSFYPGGQSAPNPRGTDYTPGQLLGSVSGELGLRRFLEDAGHTLVVTADQAGPGSAFDRELPDADVVICQPSWPAYLTRERITRARNLKLAITAGIGSDHVDLRAASEAGITVAEVTYSSSVSVAEHAVMMILALVRNFLYVHGQVIRGNWNIADSARRSYDLEGMTVGSVGAGRTGTAVLRRLRPFAGRLLYTDPRRLPAEAERQLGLTFFKTAADMVPHCDVVTISAPLHPGTEGLFGDELVATMRRGAYLVNTARPGICDPGAVARALDSGQLAGYAADAWFPQPASADHPWHGMLPPVSGTSLPAQARYAAGTREILECWLDGRPIRDEYLIAAGGALAGTGARSYQL